MMMTNWLLMYRCNSAYVVVIIVVVDDDDDDDDGHKITADKCFRYKSSSTIINYKFWWSIIHQMKKKEEKKFTFEWLVVWFEEFVYVCVCLCNVFDDILSIEWIELHWFDRMKYGSGQKKPLYTHEIINIQVVKTNEKMGGNKKKEIKNRKLRR